MMKYTIIIVILIIIVFIYYHLININTNINTEKHFEKTSNTKYYKIANNHSLIPTYPPNIIKYPDFYKYDKEYIVILHPGEALYIPPKWFHWVFSYPDKDKTNIAISYFIHGENIHTQNEPVKYSLKKDNFDYFDYSLDKLEKIYPNKKHSILKSKNNIITPVHKPTLKPVVIRDNLTFNEIKKQSKQYNIYMTQNHFLKFHKLPNCIKDKFPKSHYHCFHWLAAFKPNTEFIDSGLHYDISAGFLISVKGIKMIRLYHPDNNEFFYLKDMYYRRPK